MFIPRVWQGNVIDKPPAVKRTLRAQSQRTTTLPSADMAVFRATFLIFEAP